VVHWLGAAEIARGVRDGTLSTVEVVKELLSRTDALDPVLKAYSARDPARVLADAESAELRRAAGEPLAPLHGVPFAAKDLFDVAGMPTKAGSRVLPDRGAERDAVVIERLRTAGMIFLGKTHTVEFAFGGVGINHSHGTPHNPWHPEPHVPGGSSSGSGVAVAAGLAPLALGTDTGGSVRIPAALCGIVGLKPTFGAVSRSGVFALSRTLDSVGPLARTVEDTALFYESMRGPDDRDPGVYSSPASSVMERLHEGVAGVRVGIPTNFFFDDVEPELVAAVHGAAEVLAGLGAEVSMIEFPAADAVAEVNPRGFTVGTEAYALHAKRLATHAEGMDPVVAIRLPAGRDVMASEYLAALEGLDAVRARSLETFSTVDVLLAPTTMSPALPVADVDVDLQTYARANARYLRNTAVGNALGLCGLSVPCGITAADLPIGLMIYGRPFGEGEVLRVGQAFEQATEWHLSRPDLEWAVGR